MKYIDAMDEHRDRIKQNINESPTDENIIIHYCPNSFFDQATALCHKNIKFDGNATCEECWNRELEVIDDAERD